MIRLLKVALLSVLLAIGLNANDFLAKATGGVLSDTSVGIKQLNETELQEILGGYAFYWLPELSESFGSFKTYAFAVLNDDGSIPTNLYEGGNLPPQTLLIAKMRLGVGTNPTHYLQVYRADKSHTEYSGRDFGVILEQFKAYTSNW